MERDLRSTTTATVIFVGICLSASALARRPPEKHANSATPKPETLRTAKSGQATVDYIVSGVLDDMHIYMDRHFHKGEYNHTLNLRSEERRVGKECRSR